MLAFFLSPQKEHPLRRTLMTSSKRQQGQRAVFHAVSHLVLFTNLKKRHKATDTGGGEEAEEEKETGLWILKKGCKWWFWVLIGQPGWAAVKSIPEWGGLGRGTVGYGPSPRALKIHSAGTCLGEGYSSSICHQHQLDHSCPSPLGVALSPPTFTSVKRQTGIRS